MTKKAIDTKKLSGEELYYYYLHICPDKEYVSLVKMLPLAIGGLSEAYDLLERIEREEKKLIAIYPGINDNLENNKDLEYLGPIMDGALYIG